jgi:hypothetical protein
MQPRQRSWAFDQYPEMPHGKQWVLKVKVPAASPPAQLMDMAGALKSGLRRHGINWPTHEAIGRTHIHDFACYVCCHGAV